MVPILPATLDYQSKASSCHTSFRQLPISAPSPPTTPSLSGTPKICANKKPPTSPNKTLPKSLNPKIPPSHIPKPPQYFHPCPPFSSQMTASTQNTASQISTVCVKTSLTTDGHP